MFNRINASVATYVLKEENYVLVRLNEKDTYYRGSSVSASLKNTVDPEGKYITCQEVIIDGKKVTSDDSRIVKDIDPMIKAKFDAKVEKSLARLGSFSLRF